MAAIGVLHELRFSKARFALEKKLANLERSVDKDARRTPKIETDDISIMFGECRQKPELVGAPKLIIESAQGLSLRAGRCCCHNLTNPI
jgi:hypothetical protein